MRTRLALAILLSLFAALCCAQGKNVPPTASFKAIPKLGAGAQGQAVLQLTFGEGLHGYQNPPSENYMIPVEVKLDSASGFKLVKVDYPKGTPLVVGGSDKPVLTYGGTIEIPITFEVPKQLGASKLKAEIAYQQCNERSCFLPGHVEATSDVAIAEKGDPVAPISTAPKTAPETTPAAETPKQEGGLAGFIQGAFASHNYALILPLLFLAGLVINLTPCVYPVIPITITFFANQSAGNRAAKFQLGLLYMLGIAVTYGSLGGAAAALGGTFGALFENRWFLIALGLMMVGLALSMFDLYQIGIPTPIAKQLKGRSGPVGALIMGMLVGVAAAPCAGPLVVAILAEIAKLRSVPLGVGLFVMVGLGLGLPYMVLSAVSVGAKALPKAGGWMKTVKSLLGLLVIGLGVNYLAQAFGRELGPSGVQWVWIAFYVLSAAYLFLIENAGSTRFILGLKGASILVFGMLAGTGFQNLNSAASAPKVAWTAFTQAAFEEAKKAGKPIVIDFGANWCVQCHEIDERVFDKPEVVAALKGAQTFKVDWSTGVDPSYKDQTAKQFGVTGLPHIIVMKPGGESPVVKNGFETPKEFLDLLAVASKP